MYALIFLITKSLLGFVINTRNQAYIKAFGANLIKIRKIKKMSQEDLAFTADLSLSQIGRIERGEINATISTIYVIAKALKIHPQELYSFEMTDNEKKSNGNN